MVRLRRMIQPVIRICRGGAHNPTTFRHCRRQKLTRPANAPAWHLKAPTTWPNCWSSNCGSAAALRPLIGRASGPRGSRWRRPPGWCWTSVAFRKEFRGIEPATGRCPVREAATTRFFFRAGNRGVLSSARSEPPDRMRNDIDRCCSAVRHDRQGIDRLGSSANGDVRGPGEADGPQSDKTRRSDAGSFVTTTVGAHVDSWNHGRPQCRRKTSAGRDALLRKLRHYPPCQHLQNRHARGG
jgi:hypothetical protein